MPPIASPHRPRIAALLREYPRENAPQIVARLAAEGISISPATVVRVAKAEGLERPKGRPAEGRDGSRDLVLSLHAEGLDPEEIATALREHRTAAEEDPALGGRSMGTSLRLVHHYLSATGEEEK